MTRTRSKTPRAFARISINLFNVHMAKNTSKKVSNKKLNLFQKLLKTKWYIKALLILTVVILGFLIFKKCMNTYNISLLDKAEAKMRQMDLPKADSTEYRRSCSFRSVKFGGAGSPNCHLQRIDTFKIETLEEGILKAAAYLNQYKSQYPYKSFKNENLEELKNNIRENIDNAPYLEINSMQKGLRCYVVTRVDNETPQNTLSLESANSDQFFLIASTTCSRRFMFQTYPELN